MTYKRPKGGTGCPGLWCALLLFLVWPGIAAQDTSRVSTLEPEIGEFAKAFSAVPEVVRVVTFNVHLGADVAKLGQSIQENANLCEASIFLLQEIERFPDENGSRTRALAEALQLNYVYAPAREVTRQNRSGTHGLAILSRFPLKGIQIIPLPRFNLRYNTRNRIAVAATVTIGSRAVRIYNVHLDTRINSSQRLKQLQPVIASVRDGGDVATVIGGDFNTNSVRWLWNMLPIFRSNQPKAVDKFMQKEDFYTPFSKDGSTNRGKIFRMRLDTLYVRGVEVRGRGIERNIDSSDHLPLWIDIAWPGEGRTTDDQNR